MHLCYESLAAPALGTISKRPLADAYRAVAADTPSAAPTARHDAPWARKRLISTLSTPLRGLPNRFGLHSKIMSFRITAVESADLIEHVHDIATQMGIELRRWQSRKDADGFVVEFDADVTLPKERELLSKLGALHAHTAAHPVR